MSLNNLVGISLEKINPNPQIIKRLLYAAERNLLDAQVTQISLENRLDTAYKSIMQLANATLQANGYRTLTSKPGHHILMLQSLGQTIALKKDFLIVLDALRKQRNIIDYCGDAVPETMVNECLDYARQLNQSVLSWFELHKPTFLN